MEGRGVDAHFLGRKPRKPQKREKKHHRWYHLTHEDNEGTNLIVEASGKAEAKRVVYPYWITICRGTAAGSERVDGRRVLAAVGSGTLVGARAAIQEEMDGTQQVE